MSRRTPIKELIAEEAGTPSSPIRRSSRIATRRSSAHEEIGSQKAKDDDQISVSSTSSIGSKSGRNTRTSSMSLENDLAKIPVKRTRKGSTSSLIEEELVSINRGGSPAPGRVTRRNLTRSLSVSPVSELESRTRKTTTPQKSVSESATAKGGGKKSRRLSVSDTISPLESIKEVESSPQKENSNKNTIENTCEKDLPIKKKKSSFLQTISEKSFTGDIETDKTENNSDSDQIDNTAEMLPSVSKNKPVETEIENNEKHENPALSLKPKPNSNSLIEEKELIVVLNNIDKLDCSHNKSTDSNVSQDNEHCAPKNNAEEPISKNDYNLLSRTKLSLDNETQSQVTINVESSKTSDPNVNNVSIEVNENKQQSKHSFCEPMDVDVSVLDSSLLSSNQNDKDATASDIKSPKSTEKSNDEIFDNARINQIGSISTSMESTNDCASLGNSTLHTLPNNSLNELDTSKKSESIKYKDSLTIDSLEKISSCDLVESTSLETVPLDTSLSLSNKKSAEAEHTELDVQTTPSTNKNISIIVSPVVSLDTSLSSSFNQSAEVKHTELDVQNTLSTNKNVSIFITPVKDLKSNKSNLSPDQSNISTDLETNKIIVATNTTPVRRSPRLNSSLDKIVDNISNDSISDVLKINTPPESINSENSSRDDVEVSVNEEHKNDVAEDVSDNITINIDDDVEEITEKVVQNVQSKSCSEEEEDTNISQTEMTEVNTGNKSKSTISFNSEPELNTTLQSKIAALTEALEVDSSSDESVNNYIDNMAEEGEEDTPSESSNDIIDLGESIGSTASEIDSDESYEVDSFIDDDGADELLSGEEYDLGQEKRKPKSPKRKRIIKLNDSSDKEEGKAIETDNDDVQILEDSSKVKDKAEEESDIENMSTQAFCGLTPPSIVSVRESPSEEETKTCNHKDDEESITSVLINKEDNLDSLEEIKDQSKEFSKTITPIKLTEAEVPTTKEKINPCTPNNSILENSNARHSDSKQQRKRLSSLTIQETVNVKDISDHSISDRILKVVEVFCSTVTKSGDPASGNISLNVSLDYISTSPDKPNIHDEHKEVITIESLRQSFKSDADVGSSTDKSESSKKIKRKRSLEIKKHSPVKISFENCSTSDEQLSEKEYPIMYSPEEQSKKIKTLNTQKSSVSLNESSSKKKKKNRKNQKIDMTEGGIDEPLKRDKKTKRTKKIEEIVDESDSDMSPDLDKEFDEKYNNSSGEEDNSSDVENTKIKESQIGNFKKPKKQVITKLSVKSSKTVTPENDTRTISEHEVLQSEDTSHISKSKRNKNDNEINPAETSQEPKRKRQKVKETSTESGWKIQYLPHDIKVALSSSKSSMHSKSYITQKDQTKNIVPKKKPRLVPSLDSGKLSWHKVQLKTTIKPSTSSEINKNKEFNAVIVEAFHPKDFKNRTLFNSKRLNRVETKELLKKREKTHF